ncbi:MAG TPA: ATP-binding protein [Acidimicrobiia bacterium]|nr:ATP-binding protein [Acidimicrobiia bacterium]
MILPPSVHSPAIARRFCDAVLGEVGCGADMTADARLVVSELVTNAVLHADTAIDLEVFLRDDGALRIEVTDLGSDRPQVWARDDTRGRGLPIVAALASAWGIIDLGSGKTVWCELASAGATAIGHAHRTDRPPTS